MVDRTPYQDKIIKNYYANRDVLMQQKVSDMISDLYLVEGKKRVQLWRRIALALTNLGVSQEQIDYLQEQDNPELLLKYVQP
ncbi:MAG: hypothetical protein Q4G59_10355 [Planctomycetia bacterium]|nr:hypothetical protein [Planctomycetia bacterium]